MVRQVVKRTCYVLYYVELANTFGTVNQEVIKQTVKHNHQP